MPRGIYDRKASKSLLAHECVLCHRPAKGQGARFPSGKSIKGRQLFYIICGTCNKRYTFDKEGEIVSR